MCGQKLLDQPFGVLDFFETDTIPLGLLPTIEKKNPNSCRVSERGGRGAFTGLEGFSLVEDSKAGAGRIPRRTKNISITILLGCMCGCMCGCVA